MFYRNGALAKAIAKLRFDAPFLRKRKRERKIFVTEMICISALMRMFVKLEASLPTRIGKPVQAGDLIQAGQAIAVASGHVNLWRTGIFAEQRSARRDKRL